jgi:hypothetical protein
MAKQRAGYAQQRVFHVEFVTDDCRRGRGAARLLGGHTPPIIPRDLQVACRGVEKAVVRLALGCSRAPLGGPKTRHEFWKVARVAVAQRGGAGLSVPAAPARR